MGSSQKRTKKRPAAAPSTRSARPTSEDATAVAPSSASPQDDAVMSESSVMETRSSAAAVAAASTDTTRGQNVSGRPWKVVATKRASSLIKTTFNNQSSSWDRKMADRQRRKEATALQAELKEQKKQEAIAKKARRLENETRRAENEYKAIQHSVQHLNSNKIGSTLKAMSKKQLRMVKKTRVNTKTGVVEYVPAYAK